MFPLRPEQSLALQDGKPEFTIKYYQIQRIAAAIFARNNKAAVERVKFQLQDGSDVYLTLIGAYVIERGKADAHEAGDFLTIRHSSPRTA